MDEELRALKYRAWHRGTREADMMIGGFFDARHQGWSANERAWFADLLNETDVDIMAWAIGTLPAPARYRGALLSALRQLDFIRIAK
jgi:antitoxin CptB